MLESFKFKVYRIQKRLAVSHIVKYSPVWGGRPTCVQSWLQDGRRAHRRRCESIGVDQQEPPITVGRFASLDDSEKGLSLPEKVSCLI